MRHLVFFIILMSLYACSDNTIAEIDNLTKMNYDPSEIAEDVRIVYSDSGKVQIKISAKKMIRRIKHNSSIEEFPEGIVVTFIDNNGRPSSWLEADYAERNSSRKKILARGNVHFYNAKKESLESTEITWDENKSYLDTDKFVRLIQPERGDTSYGYGFRTNEEFTRFEIKNKTSSRINIDKLLK